MKLLTDAFKAGIPEKPISLASFELLRLTANLCMDHGLPNITLMMSTHEPIRCKSTTIPWCKVSWDCSFYSESIHVCTEPDNGRFESGEDGNRRPPQLVLFIRWGYILATRWFFWQGSAAPARTHLISLKAPNAILLLARALYPPARWAVSPDNDGSLENLISSYQIRSGLADWCWRLISAIVEDGKRTRAHTTALY